MFLFIKNNEDFAEYLRFIHKGEDKSKKGRFSCV